jgi:hypothetical protein
VTNARAAEKEEAGSHVVYVTMRETGREARPTFERVPREDCR